MHIRVSPATKRHHSQISMPQQQQQEQHSNSTNHRITVADTAPSYSSSITDHGHHPFEQLMNMFGSTFHRSASRQQQYRQQSQRQHRSMPSDEQRPGAAATEYDSMLRNDNDNRIRPSYAAPATKTNPTGSSSSDSSVSSTRAIVARPDLKPSVAQPPPSSSSAWRAALCPRSNKTYYWNVHTRESRWKKPLELASEEERDAIREKERKLREFFEGMERNILRRFEEGGTKGGGARGGDAVGSPMSVATSAASASPNGDGGEGIHRSWMQPSSSAGPAGHNDDWIAGWITPGSSDASSSSSMQCSPSGSLGSSSGPGHHRSSSYGSPGSSGSLGSFSSKGREERDDRVYPLGTGRIGRSKIERIKSSSSRPVIDKPDLIRTISKMEYDLLVGQLNPSLMLETAGNTGAIGGQRLPESPKEPRADSSTRRDDDEPLTPTTATCDILSCLHLTPEAEGLAISLATSAEDDFIAHDASSAPISPLTPADNEDEPAPARSLSGPASSVAKPGLTKRNTCGTIYLGSTLSAPDKDALIKCVCGVYRAHLLGSVRTTGASPSTGEHEIFRDRRAPGDYRRLDTESVPTLAQITDFYRSIFLRSQMEVDCIIISLVYVERLIKMTSGALSPEPANWRSVLFSCMVLASKVWDDLSMWNCDFSKIGPSGVTFSLSRTNELEVALLGALEYRVKVGASEYAKYYFLLRGMLCRSGLADDDIASLRPLDTRGAAAMDATTAAGGGGEAGRSGGSSVKKPSMKERSKSYGCAVHDREGEAARTGFRRDADGGGGRAAPPQGSSPTSKRVSLEQIVRM